MLYTLLANATHLLQPADVSVFGPLKKSWFKATRGYTEETHEPITLRNVATVLSEVFKKSISPDSIINGFRATGLYPFDANAVE